MKSILNRPVIGISMGDPAGIGPEIIVKALNTPKIHAVCQPIVIGDTTILKRALKFLPVPLILFLWITRQMPSTIQKTISIINESNLDEKVIKLSRPTMEREGHGKLYHHRRKSGPK